MRRREFIAGLLVAAGMPRAQAQQPAKVYRIAMVSPAMPVAVMRDATTNHVLRAFSGELRRLGYVEGKNLVVEMYSAEGHTERYPELARNVVQTKPDVIVPATNALARALGQATTTIPIVASLGDPLADGLVASLARPGGNITGLSTDAGNELVGKLLELLREAVPSAFKVAYLRTRPEGRKLSEEAQRVGVSLIGPPLQEPIQEPEYRRVFEAMEQDRAEALIVSSIAQNYAYRRLIVELAEKHRLPAIYPYRDFVELGGLMAYAVDLDGLYVRMADQIDQVFKGAKPGEMPIEQPIKFQLLINLKAAKTLAVTVPPSLVLRADEVIE
jgi:putative tryptophan/tyrosine transport system substrate-binding protein